jgi:hypothetical protein
MKKKLKKVKKALINIDNTFEIIQDGVINYEEPDWEKLNKLEDKARAKVKKAVKHISANEFLTLLGKMGTKFQQFSYFAYNTNSYEER